MISIVQFCQHLNDKFPNAKTFFVGGCVRDALIERTPKDLDVVICHVPVDDLIKELADQHIKSDLVGKSFGVIKAKFEEGVIDIALPRRERSTGDGHRAFEVQSDPEISIEEDAARRDFTINAIYSNVLTAALEDPLGGITDLENKLLRATSSQSFEEDPLRVLRAIQFCARFGLTLEKQTKEDLCAAIPKLDTVSSERIALELNKLMLAEEPSIGLNIALKTGVLGRILPQLSVLNTVDQPAKWHDCNAFVHTLRVVDHVRPETNIRFAALFHDLGKATTKIFHEGRIAFHGHEDESAKIAETIIDRLALTCIEGFKKEHVLLLVKKHMYDRHHTTASAIRRLVRTVGGLDAFHDLAQLKCADVLGGGHPHKVGNQLEYLKLVLEVMARTTAKTTRDLAVNGHDLMETFDLKPGPKIGEVLTSLFEATEEDLVANEKAALLEYAKRFVWQASFESLS